MITIHLKKTEEPGGIFFVEKGRSYKIIINTIIYMQILKNHAFAPNCKGMIQKFSGNLRYSKEYLVNAYINYDIYQHC